MGSRHLGGCRASRPRLGGTPRPTPAWEGRAPARPLTGKAAFQAARSRRALIENWQHWDWQHFHIGNTPRYILPRRTFVPGLHVALHVHADASTLCENVFGESSRLGKLYGLRMRIPRDPPDRLRRDEVLGKRSAPPRWRLSQLARRQDSGSPCGRAAIHCDRWREGAGGECGRNKLRPSPRLGGTPRPTFQPLNRGHHF